MAPLFKDLTKNEQKLYKLHMKLMPAWTTQELHNARTYVSNSGRASRPFEAALNNWLKKGHVNA